ncbi:MAG: hypothetical protein RLZZ524_2610 [Pseudomonadota bacterium]|jgi:hypothetical protein
MHTDTTASLPVPPVLVEPPNPCGRHLPLYLIGLTGQAGAGKDSCAEALEFCGFQRLAFADALRHEISQAFGIDPRMLTDRATKETPLQALSLSRCGDPFFLHWAVYYCGHSLYEPRSPRWLMQRWGTEYRRRHDPSYWSRQVHNLLTELISQGRRRFVVTDVRYTSEEEMLLAFGALILRVIRPGLPALPADTADHTSERDHALPAHAVITNSGTLEDLGQSVIRTVLDVYGWPALQQIRHPIHQIDEARP